MTDNQIVGRMYALLNDLTEGYGTETIKYALDLINRQKAEIERLQSENLQLKEDLFNETMCYTSIFQKLNTSKAEAIKEFAERLKAEACLGEYPWDDERIYLPQIDNLLKEMVGEDE